MGVVKRLGDLQRECKNLNIAIELTDTGYHITDEAFGISIPVTIKLRANKLTRRDYTRALCEHFLKVDFPNGPPEHLKQILA